MVGGEIKNGDSKLKLNKVTASKKSPQTTLYRRWHKVGGGHHGGNFLLPSLSVQWLMSRWDLAGNLNHPLKMTHHKSDAGETPLGLFPPVDMSFLGRGQKDDAKRQEASEEIEGGSQSPNAGHRSMQGIAFFGDPPPQNGRGAICRTIWTLHPSEIERPYITYIFFLIFFSTLQYG